MIYPRFKGTQTKKYFKTELANINFTNL